MFTVVYEFLITDGSDERFREAWRKHTEFVSSTRGSLGSRLHTTGAPNTYVAYAQWPDRERWAETSMAYREAQPETLQEMKKYLIKSSVLRELSVCDDMLE